MHKKVQEHRIFLHYGQGTHTVILLYRQKIQTACKTCGNVHCLQLFVIVVHFLVLCPNSNNFSNFWMNWNLWHYKLVEVVFSIDGRNLQYIM